MADEKYLFKDKEKNSFVFFPNMSTQDYDNCPFTPKLPGWPYIEESFYQLNISEKNPHYKNFEKLFLARNEMEMFFFPRILKTKLEKLDSTNTQKYKYDFRTISDLKSYEKYLKSCIAEYSRYQKLLEKVWPELEKVLSPSRLKKIEIFSNGQLELPTPHSFKKLLQPFADTKLLDHWKVLLEKEPNYFQNLKAVAIEKNLQKSLQKLKKMKELESLPIAYLSLAYEENNEQLSLTPSQQLIKKPHITYCIEESFGLFFDEKTAFNQIHYYHHINDKTSYVPIVAVYKKGKLAQFISHKKDKETVLLLQKFQSTLEKINLEDSITITMLNPQVKQNFKI